MQVVTAWLRSLVAGLSPRRPGFATGSIHVGFVVDKVALGRFSPSSSVSPANIIPPLLHIHLSPPHGVCDCSDQAAHYYNLGPKLGASLLTRHIGWKQKQKERKKLVHKLLTLVIQAEGWASQYQSPSQFHPIKVLTKEMWTSSYHLLY
jgi:hypothetical protein